VALFSWVGPALFERTLRRELEAVTLKPDF
jgi:hypothetical protein